MVYLVNLKKWFESNGKVPPCPKVTNCIINAPNPNVCKVDLNSGDNPNKGCLIKIG